MKDKSFDDGKKSSSWDWSYDDWDSWDYGYGGSYTGTGYSSTTTSESDSKDTFFGKRYKSSLGWSSSKLSSTTSTKWSWWGSSYSTASRSADSDAKNYELLKKAYSNTREMIVILDFPFNVYIQTTTSNPIPGTDKTGRKIIIPTKVMDDKSRDDDTKVVVICGLGIHEAAHLKYTAAQVIDKYKKGLIEGRLSESEVELALMLSNYIEDARVENKLLEERPGFAEFFDKTNDWKFEELDNAFKLSEKEKEVETFLKNVIALICFPNRLNKEFIMKYESAFNRFRSIIYPLPQNTMGSCMQGFELFKAIREEFKHFDLDKITGPLQALRKLNSATKSAIPLSEVLQGEDGESTAGLYLTDKMLEKHISDVLKDKESIVSELLDGSLELGSKKTVLFKKMTGNKLRYNSIKAEISKYIPVVKKSIKGVDKNYDFIVHGCRAGLLDESKIVEAVQEVPQVYLRQGHVKTNKTTVCVLVDESGSMNGSKITNARKAAILLNESLKDAGVDLYIYGHSADEVYSEGDTYLRVYKERGMADLFALSAISAHYENRDGSAIREVAKRVRKFTDSRCIFFIISDGEPCAQDYYGDAAMNDVKRAVSEVENDNFDVIQITIDGASPELAKRRMGFKHVIDLRDNISELPKSLSKVVKKAVMENKKTTTEL